MTDALRQDVVHFRPSQVLGIPDVDEVRVHHDRLELRSAGAWRTFRFISFATGREVVSRRAPVGEMYFSRDNYPDSHFVFYTTPRIAIFMPADGPTRYPHSHFWRIQERLGAGGFLVYDGPPKSPPNILNARPGRTAMYILAVMAFAWLYGLSGFLPGRPGEFARHFLLSNPRNPAIGLAFMLPALGVPILLAFNHGRTRRHVLAFILVSYIVAQVSEWALRRAIHSWAPLEQPPFNSVFWSARHFVLQWIPVTLAAVIAASWRRSHLEPIPISERAEPTTPKA